VCGPDMCGRISPLAGAATSFSSMINPPSTNSQIVCRRKDRGGCGVSRWWPFSLRFCLIWWQTPLRSLNICWMAGCRFLGLVFGVRTVLRT